VAAAPPSTASAPPDRRGATAGGSRTGTQTGTGTESAGPRRYRRTASAAMGQYFHDRADVEASVIECTSGARKRAAEKEEAFQSFLLRTAKVEAEKNMAILDLKAKKAKLELDLATELGMKKASFLDAQVEKEKALKFAALLERNMAIVKCNQLTGQNIPLPPLPPM
jgi:hypothetical protein